jgi:hypothetical protein
MGIEMHKIMNSKSMRSRSGKKVHMVPCHNCGRDFPAKTTVAKWCPLCHDAVKKTQADARYRKQKALKDEIKRANNTYNCQAEVLVYIMRLMYNDCPGGGVEDCSTCLFNRPFFCGCCDKMSAHPWEQSYGTV